MQRKRNDNGEEKLGEKLIKAGKISQHTLDSLLDEQRSAKCYLGRLLVARGHITEEELDAFLPKSVARQRVLSVSERCSLDAEEFYRLQTALKFALFSDDPIRTVLVTSAVPGEGKTACASYLARSIATVQQGRFLLVDADLCNPSLHTKYEVPPEPGWTDYLVNDRALEDYCLDTDIPNLQVLPAGTLPPGPGAIFASRRMKEFTRVLGDSFDLVVFDSSPLVPMPSTAVLGANLDAAIVVVKAGSTKRQLVKKAVGLLKESQTKILGVILNHVVDPHRRKYSYGYGYGYGYGSR